MSAGSHLINAINAMSGIIAGLHLAIIRKKVPSRYTVHAWRIKLEQTAQHLKEIEKLYEAQHIAKDADRKRDIDQASSQGE